MAPHPDGDPFIGLLQHKKRIGLSIGSYKERFTFWIVSDSPKSSAGRGVANLSQSSSYRIEGMKGALCGAKDLVLMGAGDAAEILSGQDRPDSFCLAIDFLDCRLVVPLGVTFSLGLERYLGNYIDPFPISVNDCVTSDQ